VKAVYLSLGAQFGYSYIRSFFEDIVRAGFNVIILSFYILSGPADWTITWKKLSDAERGEIKSYLAKNNVLLLASWGGSTGGGAGLNKCDWSWVDNMLNNSENMKALQYDGIDLDFEWITQTGPNEGCVSVIQKIYNTVKSQYGGSEEFIFISAPQTPYFSSNWALDYFTLDKQIPFDWYNIQFYNNGETDMNSTETIAAAIKNGGIPSNKIVVGKCNQGCLPEFFVGGKTLVAWTKSQGYRGVMLWEWTGNAKDWLKTTT
jgi:chitinase